MRVRIDVPATCSNLGPGLSTLALALGLYNSIEITEIEHGLHIQIEGFGADTLSRKTLNPAATAFVSVCRSVGHCPSGLEIKVVNNIPVGCGLGSTVSAILGGVVGANDILGSPLSRPRLTDIALDLSGKAHSLLAASFGNLAIVGRSAAGLIHRQVAIPPLTVCVAAPHVPAGSTVPTFPRVMSFLDATEQMGRTALVVQALSNGDFELLSKAMNNPFIEQFAAAAIPGYRQACQDALDCGAASICVSGDGPALVAFAPGNQDAIAAAMKDALERASGAEASAWVLPVDTHGISISETSIAFDTDRTIPIPASSSAIQ